MAAPAELNQCLICDKNIRDNKQGQESIFCEGKCQGWLHRTCACLSKKAFQAANVTTEPFYCQYCRCHNQEKEIARLQATVTALQTELSELKSSQVSDNDNKLDSNAPERSYANVAQSGLDVPHAPFKPTSHNPERKYNIVVYGIDECPKGLPRYMRTTRDTESVMAIIHSVDASIPEQSLRDCLRLGKFTDEKHRPILAKLSRSCEVSSILSNRGKLNSKPGISIKPDMTRGEREIESLLLKECRQLINSGTERSSIKIRGNALYIDRKKYGSVVNSTFSLHENHVINQGGDVDDTSQPQQ